MTKEEARLAKLQKENIRKLQDLYEAVVTRISEKAVTIKFAGSTFKLSGELKKFVDKQIKQLQKDLLELTVSGMKQSWGLANSKNDLMVDKRLANTSNVVSKKAKQIFYDANLGALDQFTKRKVKGLNLSDRIWKALEPFENELTKTIGLGISKGQSAREMAKDAKQYLKEPDKLFRRVRDAKGDLKLSKAAMDYKPGQGVYRSSFKNAMRLTRTENNMAYRTADFERWNKIPFVVGFTVSLSQSHPKFDICDDLKGKYPKDFMFRGWHPHCLCYATAILMTEEEFEKYNDKILGTGKIDERTISRIKNIPTSAKKWMTENKKRVQNYKSPPYWVADNPKYTEILK